ncbi:hypothetical protein [Pelagibacterium halotolerans]|uniref:hypothetical protein n=1 Tax=Pelagibacterium halotolerans TaxID=531813 RepID=UPI00384FB193
MTECLASVQRDEYDRFRHIVGDDLDWPKTFDEFEKCNAERLAKLKARGVDVQTALVTFDEFVSFCRDRGMKQDGFAFGAFAVSQDWPISSSKKKK